MRRNVLLIILLVLATAIATVACGDDDDDTVTTDDPAADDGGTVPGDDDIVGGGPYPVADLTVAYEHPDEGVSFTYRITCLGDTATVTDGEDIGVDERAACLALAEPGVQTRLLEGPPADQVCTEIYGGPDVARVTGTIDEQPVDATIDRTNGCGISDWDDLLGAVLPEPIGVSG